MEKWRTGEAIVEMRLGNIRTKAGFMSLAAETSISLVLQDLFYYICSHYHTHLLISWKEGDGMLGNNEPTLLS